MSGPEQARGRSASGGGPDVAAKEALREEMRRVRREIPPAERARKARRITASVLALPEIRSARVVLGFSSFGSEVPTAELLRALEHAGVTVLLPYVDGGEIVVTEHHEGDPLLKTAYGPHEPVHRHPVAPERVEAV
ncbi:MAG TPA: 5-formyltetrahydrofolate cyclo-ligase, partial [Acidimicrobiales bacterium]|nr:5-formyltetrahydrofolate cyclo-ligase [Acidimicrobiales bacterium]